MMDIKSSDLISIFEQSLKQLPQNNLEEIGIVVQIGDGVCTVHGLINAVYGEKIAFEGGNTGIIFQMNEESVEIFLLDNANPVAEREVAKRTKSVFKIPVDMSLLGRVINAEGKTVDGLENIDYKEFRAIETDVPGIAQRSPVNESLETGIIAIDALVPIGKGQRELIIGNRGTGKTAIAFDTILHQKDKNVLCIYVSIGQRTANVARLVKELEHHGALSYTTIVSADSGEAVLNQYLAPYVGCTLAEYYRDQGHDVLIVYDDLSNHAIAFREMSLLLRRSPGREAFPGDVFYLHSRLLERAGKIKNSGSITALPIVQIQGDDITAYIPTNLISITDGQIFLDTQLFNRGFRPAVNAELSVSRVGGSAQTKAMKKVTKALRLELAQFHELQDFAQFGAELDDVSKRQLKRGNLALELLKQSQHQTYSFVEQVCILFLLQEKFLDQLQPKQVPAFTTGFISYVKSIYQDLYSSIFDSQDLTDEQRAQLATVAQEFSQLFVEPEDRLPEDK